MLRARRHYARRSHHARAANFLLNTYTHVHAYILRQPFTTIVLRGVRTDSRVLRSSPTTMVRLDARTNRTRTGLSRVRFLRHDTLFLNNKIMFTRKLRVRRQHERRRGCTRDAARGTIDLGLSGDRDLRSDAAHVAAGRNVDVAGNAPLVSPRVAHLENRKRGTN